MYMVDSYTYPQGDIQTWDDSFGDPVSQDFPKDLSYLISRGQGYIHIVKDEPLIKQKDMMTKGIIPIDKKILERSEFRIRDKISGLLYQITEPLTIDIQTLSAIEFEILNAAEMRNRLLSRVEERCFNIQPIDSSILNAPIVDYEASTVQDCECIVREIERSFKETLRFRRLWFRGQRQEYFIKRTIDVLEWLRFGKAGDTIPSLVPSLGRYALNNPGKVDWGFAFVGPNHWWKKPFLVWVIRQNPIWLNHYPEFRDRVEESLKSGDDEKFSKILVDIMLDTKVPTEVDDLRQWFFVHYKYSAWVWVLQQYGYLASMLDITSDFDTALFFTHAKMVDDHFLLTDPMDGRVIYIFVECTNSVAFWDVDRVDWGDSDWACELPARVHCQRAGCLIGSTWFRQNLYGHLVVARIYLKGKECVSKKKVEELFPPPDKDLLLRTLLDSRPIPEGLYW